jgi:hypothetical protein
MGSSRNVCSISAASLNAFAFGFAFSARRTELAKENPSSGGGKLDV